MELIMIRAMTFWMCAGLATVSCGRKTYQEVSMSTLYEIPAALDSEAIACQRSAKSYQCNGSDCLEIEPLKPSNALFLSPDHSNWHFSSRKLSDLMHHSAEVTRCITQNWGSNNQGVVIGDVSDSKGDTPYQRHPPGTHDDGLNADIGYFQLEFPDNKLRPVCENKDYHCTGNPKYLDSYRTAVFIAAMHRHPHLRVIGVDGKIAEPILNATRELCQKGIIQGSACRGIKLAYETSDEGRGWYYHHHHHLHVSLGTRDYALHSNVLAGSYEDSGVWGGDLQSDSAGAEDLDPATAELAPSSPSELYDPNSNHCFIGFLVNSKGRALCSAWKKSHATRTPVNYFIKYETDNCNPETLAVHLSRSVYNQMVSQECSGKYSLYAAPEQKPIYSVKQVFLGRAGKDFLFALRLEGSNLDLDRVMDVKYSIHPTFGDAAISLSNSRDTNFRTTRDFRTYALGWLTGGAVVRYRSSDGKIEEVTIQGVLIKDE
jgi:hypothetical protein